MEEIINKKKEEPFRKIRIESNISALCKDDGLIERWETGTLRKRSQKKRLDQLHRVKKKGYDRAAEKLKQQIKATAATLKQYKNKEKQYWQNKLFQNNQSGAYQKLDGKSHEENIIADQEKTREFWSGIWKKYVKHNESTDWIHKLAEEMEGNKQQNTEITPTKIKERIPKMMNWKTLGPDGFDGNQIKMLVSVQERMVFHLQSCITRGEIPVLMTTGQTVLQLKDKNKRNKVSNYRPITCLPLLWKLLTGFVADGMYSHPQENNLLPEEHKCC